jgi:protocatechuate 3,4-dioxygenase beta subunit
MKFIPLLLALIPAFASVSAAAAETEDKFITTCAPTAHVRPEERLPARENVIPSGKLALPAGKSIFAPGQTVYLSGKVLDENCVPVSDAIVEIWQADASGKYVKTTLGDRLSPYPTFVSTGRAVTDNLGRYRFVTIFPGLGKESAPHIHVKVTREHFKPFETEMYFGGDARNPSEERFAELDENARRSVTARVWPRDKSDMDKGLYARWNITLAGKNRYRHY